MRHALLCSIPMLVLAAACADTDPLAPRTDTRGVSASLQAGAASLSTCDGNVMSATAAGGGGAAGVGGATSASGAYSLGTVHVFERTNYSFQLPIFMGGGYPRYECLFRALLPQLGDMTVTVAPDTTTVEDPPRPPDISDDVWFVLGRRMRAWIYQQAGEYARRCGCNRTQDQVFASMISTIQSTYKEQLERPPLVVVGRNFDDTETAILRGFTIACTVTQVYRRYWGLDDASDRAWLERGVTADVADRGLSFGVGSSYGTNWVKGVIAGFRIGDNGRCSQEAATAFYYNLLALDPAIELRSPTPSPPYSPPTDYPRNPWYDQ